MKNYDVCLPIAGHVWVQVEADSREEAIDKAVHKEDISLEDVEDWEVLRAFNRGNVCYCNKPWEATADLAFGED